MNDIPLTEYQEYNDISINVSNKGMTEIPLYSSSSSTRQVNTDYINLGDNESGYSMHNDDSNISHNSNTYVSTISSYWNYFSNIAYSIKEKIASTDVGNKVINVSGKALEYVIYAGTKVYEKGVEGFSYLKQKIEKTNTSSSQDVDSLDNGGEALIDKSNVMDI